MHDGVLLALVRGTQKAAGHPVFGWSAADLYGFTKVRVAAERASSEDFRILDELMARMDAALLDTVGYPVVDIAFHLAIARATGNGALERFSEDLRENMGSSEQYLTSSPPFRKGIP